MRPRVVVRNVLFRGPEVLLGLRRGLWECPGGKVKSESLLEACLREQLEETGMSLAGEPEFLGLAETRHPRRPWRRSIELFYAWREFSGEPRAPGHDELRWFAPGDFPRELTPGAAWLLGRLKPDDVITLGPVS